MLCALCVNDTIRCRDQGFFNLLCECVDLCMSNKCDDRFVSIVSIYAEEETVCLFKVTEALYVACDTRDTLHTQLIILVGRWCTVHTAHIYLTVRTKEEKKTRTGIKNVVVVVVAVLTVFALELLVLRDRKRARTKNWNRITRYNPHTCWIPTEPLSRWVRWSCGGLRRWLARCERALCAFCLYVTRLYRVNQKTRMHFYSHKKTNSAIFRR